jgi:hypothetical protein
MLKHIVDLLSAKGGEEEESARAARLGEMG